MIEINNNQTLLKNSAPSFCSFKLCWFSFYSYSFTVALCVGCTYFMCCCSENPKESQLRNHFSNCMFNFIWIVTSKSQSVRKHHARITRLVWTIQIRAFMPVVCTLYRAARNISYIAQIYIPFVNRWLMLFCCYS